MALTAAQAADVRWYMGYAVQGNGAVASSAERAYSNVSEAALSLSTRLATLTAPEEARIVSFFLPNLKAREAEIQRAAEGVDTAQAAVWTRNPQEMAERRSLYANLRRDLCAFLGFPPGSALAGGNRIIRA